MKYAIDLEPLLPFLFIEYAIVIVPQELKKALKRVVLRRQFHRLPSEERVLGLLKSLAPRCATGPLRSAEAVTKLDCHRDRSPGWCDIRPC